MNFETLNIYDRLLIQVELEPVQGTRFQPTGFPDLGPATYTTADGKQMILVESAQSMANRLEAICWDEGNSDWIPVLKGLPYVRVFENENVITNSILESHRLNSPYIIESQDKSFVDKLKTELGGLERGAVDIAAFVKVILKYDVGSVLHGIFLAKKELAGGRLRISRSLSSFIEAENVYIAPSGGVKFDRVDPKGDTGKGFGNVPFHREEFNAERIIAYFNLDVRQIIHYRLGETANRLLIVLAMYKVRKFLESGLRLRTACDLKPSSDLVVFSPSDFTIPSIQELESILPGLIDDATNQGLFASPPVTDVLYK
ncbi:type I-U CRISPR-associated protein Cas7 [bacterium]|nr:type I-U CRISPR-associated protein Cas7 [candidate division CSSED10-310 bacterium]